MTVYILAAMMLAVMLVNLEAVSPCGACGKKFQHAEDCWLRKQNEKGPD